MIVIRIIDGDQIREDMKESGRRSCVNELLEKAGESGGLSSAETSRLFQGLDETSMETALITAEKVRKKTKGDVASLYTCLYITNQCVNDCGYCGYRRSNESLRRITLTPEQIGQEAESIRGMGVTSAILIGGTLPEDEYKDLIVDGTRIIVESGLCPWIEFENLSSGTLKRVHDEGADHFVLFQETYDESRYKRIHRNGPSKRHYDARLEKVDEAVDAGFQNIGISALFGLTGNYLFEVLGLYQHAKHLQDKGANVCISISTLKPAPGLSISGPMYRMSEHDVEKIAVALRLSLPEASLALSGRETSHLRNRLFGIVDQIGSGGVTNPGGRTSYKEEYERGDSQFTLYETRTPRDVMTYLNQIGIRIVPLVGWGSKNSHNHR